jgi:hypothetical protein
MPNSPIITFVNSPNRLRPSIRLAAALLRHERVGEADGQDQPIRNQGGVVPTTFCVDEEEEPVEFGSVSWSSTETGRSREGLDQISILEVEAGEPTAEAEGAQVLLQLRHTHHFSARRRSYRSDAALSYLFY